MNGHWPLYVAYENEDPDGFSRVYVTGSLDGGATRRAPIRVNDGPDDVEALQPRVEVAPNGTVAVAFYDRRLACPSQDDLASGVRFDPLAPAQQIGELKTQRLALPRYSVLKIDGEAHEQTFNVECRVEELGLAAEGQGASRRGDKTWTWPSTDEPTRPPATSTAS